MAEYISREAAITHIKENQCKGCSDIGLCGNCAVLIALKLLKNVPAADVRPVMHGNWMHGKETGREYLGDCLVGVFYDRWTCSECGYIVDGHTYSRINYNFCPHCGADMREPQILEIAGQSPDADVMTPATSKCKVKKSRKIKKGGPTDGRIHTPGCSD